MTRCAATPRGKFIVLEGIDGSGTTTQGRLLVETLVARGKPAHFTHEPSVGPVGTMLRRFLRGELPPLAGGFATMALMFAADRCDHVAREIEPMLAVGTSVVCDRYDLSSLAYQSATAGEGEAVLPFLVAINRYARRPDLTVVVNVTPDQAELRREGRGGAPELFERRDLQRRLADLYLRAEQLVPGDRLVPVDGGGSIEQVHALIVKAIEAEMGA